MAGWRCPRNRILNASKRSFNLHAHSTAEEEAEGETKALLVTVCVTLQVFLISLIHFVLGNNNNTNSSRKWQCVTRLGLEIAQLHLRGGESRCRSRQK